MALVPPIEYEEASPAVRSVYDDIRATRKNDYINNFWKVLAHDPAMLARTWANVKEVMGPGAIDPLVKELMFDELIAVTALANATNRLANGYRIDVDERFASPLAP